MNTAEKLIDDIATVLSEYRKKCDKNYEDQIWEIEAMINNYPVSHTKPKDEGGLRDGLEMVLKNYKTNGIEDIGIKVIENLMVLNPTPTSQEPLEDLARRKGCEVLIRLDTPIGGTYDLTMLEARLWLEKLADKEEGK